MHSGFLHTVVASVGILKSQYYFSNRRLGTHTTVNGVGIHYIAWILHPGQIYITYYKHV